MSLIDQLHDEVDELERIKALAGDAVRDVFEKRLTEALNQARVDGGINVPMAMALLASWVEDALTDITTEAFQSGHRLAAMREADPE